ncbi:MAG: hypothetical protein JW973_06625 [Bacteroidales bacterium]|nr:hypothetical protein [Bacteroidales bacterium]
MKNLIYCLSIVQFILYGTTIHGKCESNPGSLINIYIINQTFKMNSPIEIRFNDSLVISEAIVNYYNIRYRLFSKGVLKISAQIRDYSISRTEYTLMVRDDSCYNVIIKFENVKNPGAIYNVRKTDGTNLEAYCEETVIQPVYLNMDSVFDDNRAVAEKAHHGFSVNHFLLENSTMKFAPIIIRVNDQPMIFKDCLAYSTVFCRLFTEGKIKISAQLGEFPQTKTETEINISNCDSNYIKIDFQSPKKKGAITLLDKEEGVNMTASHREKWKISDLNDDNSVYLEENISHPFAYIVASEDDYLAFQQEKSKEDDYMASQDVKSKVENSLEYNSYNYKTASDMIIRTMGDTICIRKIEHLGIDDTKLKLTYQNKKHQTIDTYIQREDVARVIIDVYNDPTVDQDVYNKINLQYLILDTVLYNSIYMTLINSPYYKKMNADIHIRDWINSIIGYEIELDGASLIGYGIVLIVYSHYIGIPMIIGGIAVACLGFYVGTLPRETGTVGDRFYNKYLKKHQIYLSGQREKINADVQNSLK